MPVIRAGFNGTVGQPSAQIVDGGLRFQRDNANYLTRAIGTQGNRTTWTYSCWIKKTEYGGDRQLWGQVATSDNSATGKWQLYWTSSNDALNIHTHSLSHLVTNTVYRDTGWYHVVQTLDTTSPDANSR